MSEDDFILSGIEDVPRIAFEFCGRCKVRLTDENNSGWWIFFQAESGQMYQLPICNDCNAADNISREKSTESK